MSNIIPIDSILRPDTEPSIVLAPKAPYQRETPYSWDKNNHLPKAIGLVLKHYFPAFLWQDTDITISQDGGFSAVILLDGQKLVKQVTIEVSEDRLAGWVYLFKHPTINPRDLSSIAAEQLGDWHFYDHAREMVAHMVATDDTELMRRIIGSDLRFLGSTLHELAHNYIGTIYFDPENDGDKYVQVESVDLATKLSEEFMRSVSSHSNQAALYAGLSTDNLTTMVAVNKSVFAAAFREVLPEDEWLSTFLFLDRTGIEEVWVRLLERIYTTNWSTQCLPHQAKHWLDSVYPTGNSVFSAVVSNYNQHRILPEASILFKLKELDELTPQNSQRFIETVILPSLSKKSVLSRYAEFLELIEEGV